jgi:hypothetical protein
MFQLSQRLLVLMLAAASLVAIEPDRSEAQDPSALASSKLQISHRQPEAAKVPLPGSPMQLTVELVNSRDVEAKIRLVGSRDGRFMDIAFPLGALNKLDHAEFSVSIPAPLAAMTYQFVVHQPDGSLTTSARYLIKRPCIQNFRVEVDKDDPNARVKHELGTLIAKSKTLERDTQNLDAALKALKEISATLNQ